METLAALNLADVISPIVSILYVAIGLGLVIFFHELGHFAVAKWCGVHVERFSIGFGPIIWSRQKGETEYAVSAIPFGGYVKMLGQDDLDPNQMADGAIAQNPRSYSAKSVPQRMAIIAAGVTMNVITGLLFFAVAFRLGVLTPPATVGAVVPGSSAWKAGLKRGDDITHVDGSQVKSFMDLTLSVALSSYDIVVEGVRTDETPFKTRVTPDASGNRRTIGVVPVMGLELNVPPDAEYGPTSPGLPGSQADPSFKAGDLIRSVGGEAVSEFAELAELLAKRRDEDLEFIVDRTDENGQVSSVSTTVSARRFHSLGLWMDIGGIVAIRENSPAASAGFQVDDKIKSVGGMDVGTQIDVMRLPDFFAEQHGTGEPVRVEVSRKESGGSDTVVELSVRADGDPGWVERPLGSSMPLSIPSIGIAFHVLPYIRTVVDGSPAAKAGIKAGSIVREVQFVLVNDSDEEDGYSSPTLKIELDEKPDEGEPAKPVNWAYVFWIMQKLPHRTIKIDTGESSLAEFAPHQRLEIDDWYLPIRGLRLVSATQFRQAETLAEAWTMGLVYTKNTAVQIYLTLRSLVRRDLSPKELHGPIGIATVGYKLAREGISKLLLFLGFLSVNLAVLNFLPIPVLDGGHMVFLIWEGITRRRPSERVLIAATYVGMAFVLSLMLFVIYLDIFVHWLG